MNTSNILSLPSPWAWDAILLVCGFFNLFHHFVSFSVDESFKSLVNLIPKYVILFGAIISGIVFLIYFSTSS